MGWVMWMLLQHMGRDNILRGLHDFQTAYADNVDHPVLQDLTAFLRAYAPDAESYDVFVKQWFHEVVIAEYKLEDAKKTRVDGRFRATVRVKNAGTGTMPVTLAAVKGDRFDEAQQPAADYEVARQTIALGAGETKEVTIECDFEPDTIVVDPDALVLQLRRKFATAKL